MEMLTTTTTTNPNLDSKIIKINKVDMKHGNIE